MYIFPLFYHSSCCFYTSSSCIESNKTFFDCVGAHSNETLFDLLISRDFTYEEEERYPTITKHPNCVKRDNFVVTLFLTLLFYVKGPIIHQPTNLEK